MRTPIVDGRSIEQFIPADLRGMFYKHPMPQYKYAIHDGYDPYGFSTEGLVFYLPLWALQGDSFKSVDAYKHTCTVNGALWIPKGRDFNGINAYLVTPALAPLEFGTGDFTISSWVNLDTVGGVAQVIVRLSHNTGVASDYRSAGFFEQGGAIYAHSRTAAGSERTAANAIAATTWYRLTVVRISEVVYGYINGAAMTTTGTAGADFDYSSGGKVYIGAGDNNAGGVAYFTEGIIGEVSIYNRALTPQEIQHNYLATKWRYS